MHQSFNLVIPLHKQRSERERFTQKDKFDFWRFVQSVYLEKRLVVL